MATTYLVCNVCGTAVDEVPEAEAVVDHVCDDCQIDTNNRYEVHFMTTEIISYRMTVHARTTDEARAEALRRIDGGIETVAEAYDFDNLKGPEITKIYG